MYRSGLARVRANSGSMRERDEGSLTTQLFLNAKISPNEAVALEQLTGEDLA
ncbi:hypothetical protein FP2506_05631 [Fulvimarina pelagi HTCC2506]|uniref:Uncharacterized protein n=1 Tax=Fulvimarina pelagi HTCC2506 TaxID=314231 RepID=Q0G7S0_9HYPH|nr:hypothetical protein FP2506_05631 [Fulvimarina pelagi HTCC2506]